MNIFQKSARFCLNCFLAILLAGSHIAYYWNYKRFGGNRVVHNTYTLGNWIKQTMFLPLFLIVLPIFIIGNTLSGNQCQVSKLLFGSEK